MMESSWESDNTFSMRYALGLFVHITYRQNPGKEMPAQLIAFSPIDHTRPTYGLIEQAMQECLDQAGVLGKPVNIRPCFSGYPDKNNVFTCADVEMRP